MEPQHITAFKKILSNYSNDPIDALLTWIIDEPDTVKMFVDSARDFEIAKSRLENLLQI